MIKFWSKFHFQVPWDSFTRDNRFLLTPSQILSRIEKNLSCSPSRHINNSLISVYLFLDSELSIVRWKHRSRELSFKSYFFVAKKAIKKQTCSAWIFYQSPMQMRRGAYIPYFKVNAHIFCCSINFEERINLQVRVNIMVNENTFDYQLSPSELTQGYTLSYFYGLRRTLYIYRIFIEFLLKPVYPTMFAEKFQIHGVKITGKYSRWSKKMNLFIFTQSKTQAFPGFYPRHSRRKEITHFPRTKIFVKSTFPQQKEGRIMELKNLTKLNLQRHWPQVFINSNIFATFSFSVSVLLCHNLYSSKVKCEGSLT